MGARSRSSFPFSLFLFFPSFLALALLVFPVFILIVSSLVSLSLFLSLFLCMNPPLARCFLRLSLSSFLSFFHSFSPRYPAVSGVISFGGAVLHGEI